MFRLDDNKANVFVYGVATAAKDFAIHRTHHQIFFSHKLYSFTLILLYNNIIAKQVKQEMSSVN